MSCHNTEITPKMIESGNKIASSLVDASISKSAGGLGGSKTFEEYLELNKSTLENVDLILDYVEDRIDAVTAIYIAMSRSR